MKIRDLPYEHQDAARVAIAAIRQQYVEAGATLGPPCHDAECLRVATVRVYWPVLPGEAFPVYCAEHAEMGVRILEAMGQRAHVEALPRPPTASTDPRQIDFDA